MDFPPMPLLPISSPRTIDACKSLPLRPSDIFICSYPKSGTTWTQHIVLTLLLAERRHRATSDGNNSSSSASARNDSARPDLEYNHVSEYAPFFEIDAHWDHETNCLAKSIQSNHNRLNQRVFNTHLRWEMLPKTAQANNPKISTKRPACGKFIYVTRNLLDVCASFYHHLSNQKEGTYQYGFATFARDWMDGKVPFGSPLHHLLSFAEGLSDNKYANDHDETKTNNDQPLLLLSYEAMKSNLRQEVLRIMEFLHLTNIPMKVLDNEILPTFEFQSMIDNIDRFQPRSVTWLNGFRFLRRGESGDGKAMMAAAVDGSDDKSCLLDKYDEWVERECYIEHIHELFNCSSNSDRQQLQDVFISVVKHA
jgi:hypothetical protein